MSKEDDDKEKSSSLKIRRLINSRDKGSGQTSNVIAKLFRVMLIELDITLDKFTILKSKWLNDPNNHIRNTRTAKSTASSNLVKDIIGVLESNIYPVSNFYCEPNLGKKNLYPTTSKKDAYNKEFKYMMEILTWADGKNSLLDISNKLKVPLWELLPISNRLRLKGVIKYKKYKMK